MVEGSNYIIKYIADMSNVISNVKKLEKLNKQLVSAYGKQAPKAVKKLEGSLRNVSKTKIFDQKGVLKGVQSVDKLGQSFKTADGKLKTFTSSQKVMKNGTTKVTSSLKDMNKNTVSLGENIKRLASRAALTIPLWLALRGAVMGTIRTFKDGIKTIAEQDKAFQKARRNLEATAGSQTELNTQFASLQKRALEMSLKTGKSVEEITHAFQRFATAGFDAEASFAGMENSVKLATVEFGDARQTADAFSRSMRVLVDTSAGAESAGQQIAKAMALTDQLWQSNAFEIDEFTNNLRKFAGTAKVANLSTAETIQLLATLSTGGLAGEAGRLMKTTIIKALADMDKVVKALNIDLDKSDTTFSTLIKILEALKTFDTDKLPTDLAKTMKDLFRIRGTRVIATLTEMQDLLKENAKVVGDTDKLNSTFNKVSQTTGILADRFTNANREIGKALVTGIVGGEDFNGSLKRIVNNLEEISKKAQNAGKFLRDISITTFTGGLGLAYFKYFEMAEKKARQISGINERMVSGLNNQLNPNELSKLVAGLARLDDLSMFGGERTLTNLGEQLGKQIDDINERILQAFGEGLDKEELQKLLNDLSVTDANLLGMDKEEFQQVNKLLENSLKKAVEQVEEQKKKDLSIPIGVDIKTSELKEVNQTIIDNYINQLESEGQLKSEVLDRKTLLENMLGVKTDKIDLLQRELDKERAISEEKELQSRLSSDAVKLYRIAKEEGVGVARRIGDVISGEADFDIFVKQGGKALDVFKDQFKGLFEQQQAQAFFRGEPVPGERGLRGGAGISLRQQDEGIRGLGSVTQPLSQKDRLLRQIYPEKKDKPTTGQVTSFTPNITVPTNLITNIDISSMKMVEDKVVQAVANQITSIGSPIRKAIANAFYGKQTNRL